MEEFEYGGTIRVFKQLGLELVGLYAQGGDLDKAATLLGQLKKAAPDKKAEEKKTEEAAAEKKPAKQKKAKKAEEKKE